jgi:site-specific DNA recombinase
VTIRFAFYGRVSTEDNQDPEASRNWQLARSRALIDKHGSVVEEYFDIGQSRSIPWKRRPAASQLLDVIRDGAQFEAVVIGEPQRAFYGNQYGLTFPVFVHYGIGLWVPEVGGAIDPDAEAHDLIMSVFGGMSKGERNRIKIRVRTAMAAQAHVEGRFLGGRPPYGYRLADAGPHPNPAKAADGRRLRVLDPDPVAGPVVKRIFTEYLDGLGIFTIAEGLTSDGIPCPSAHDPARNRHRSGAAWSKGAIRVILGNPRYTGRQVWNKQRKDEVLIDVDDVALGHESRLRWNDRDAWVWSSEVVHEPLIGVDDFQNAQDMLAGGGRAKSRTRERVRRPYVLRGLVHCGVCERRMQGQWNHNRPYYRCRYPREYALANTVDHPGNVYVAEDDVLPALDGWLAGLFEPEQIERTVEVMVRSQPDSRSDPAATDAARVAAECDTKLARYRAALEAGTDPALVAMWTAEVQAHRAAALARVRVRTRTQQEPMNETEIRELIEALGEVRAVLGRAATDDRAAVYRQLGLRLTYVPEIRTVRAAIEFSAHSWGYGLCPRGDLNPHALLGH